jgi:hypothetical protein
MGLPQPEVCRCGRARLLRRGFLVSLRDTLVIFAFDTVG